MHHINAEDKWEELQELASAFRQSAVILTASEIGLFRVLSQSPASSENLCRKLNASSRGLVPLLNVLAGMDLLAKKEGEYCLSGTGERFLKEGSSEYLGDIFRHYFRLFKRWSRLEEAVLSGKPLAEPQSRARRSEADLRAFILGMENLARPAARQLAEALDLTGVEKILDLGGGPGTYLMEFLKKVEGATGTLLDFPEVVKIAREQVQSAGLSQRIEYIVGDMLTRSFKGPHHLILLCSIIHSHSESEARKIFRKSFQALSPGGRLVVKEFFLDDEGVSPLNAALFSLNMLLGTEAGRAYKWSEVKVWLGEAGFEITQTLRLQRASGAIVAQKPL